MPTTSDTLNKWFDLSSLGLLVHMNIASRQQQVLFLSPVDDDEPVEISRERMEKLGGQLERLNNIRTDHGTITSRPYKGHLWAIASNDGALASKGQIYALLKSAFGDEVKTVNVPRTEILTDRGTQAHARLRHRVRLENENNLLLEVNNILPGDAGIVRSRKGWHASLFLGNVKPGKPHQSIDDAIHEIGRLRGNRLTIDGIGELIKEADKRSALAAQAGTETGDLVERAENLVATGLNSTINEALTARINALCNWDQIKATSSMTNPDLEARESYLSHTIGELNELITARPEVKEVAEQTLNKIHDYINGELEELQQSAAEKADSARAEEQLPPISEQDADHLFGQTTATTEEQATPEPTHPGAGWNKTLAGTRLMTEYAHAQNWINKDALSITSAWDHHKSLLSGLCRKISQSDALTEDRQKAALDLILSETYSDANIELIRLDTESVVLFESTPITLTSAHARNRHEVLSALTGKTISDDPSESPTQIPDFITLETLSEETQKCQRDIDNASTPQAETRLAKKLDRIMELTKGVQARDSIGDTKTWAESIRSALETNPNKTPYTWSPVTVGESQDTYLTLVGSVRLTDTPVHVVSLFRQEETGQWMMNRWRIDSDNSIQTTTTPEGSPASQDIIEAWEANLNTPIQDNSLVTGDHASLQAEANNQEANNEQSNADGTGSDTSGNRNDSDDPASGSVLDPVHQPVSDHEDGRGRLSGSSTDLRENPSQDDAGRVEEAGDQLGEETNAGTDDLLRGSLEGDAGDGQAERAGDETSPKQSEARTASDEGDAGEQRGSGGNASGTDNDNLQTEPSGGAGGNGALGRSEGGEPGSSAGVRTEELSGRPDSTSPPTQSTEGVGEPLSDNDDGRSEPPQPELATGDQGGTGDESHGTHSEADAGTGASVAGNTIADRSPNSGSESDRLSGYRHPEGHDHDGKTPKNRVSANLAALRTLFELEEEGNREATPDEQATLANYSGWGGVHPKMFDRWASDKPSYVAAAYDQLQRWVSEDKLTEAEFDQIRSTILNAHYTHSGIIAPMWQAIDQLGIETRRILEPSCGAFNFKAYEPGILGDNAKFTGIELDSITARIAAKAHPDATVIAKGIEDTKLKNDFFDLSISNIPFGEYSVFDEEHPQWKHSIHNYFFLKNLEKVKPGGVVAFVTSRYVLDSKSSEVREALMNQAHVVDAVRLPAKTFSSNTQTDAVTDIIILQKKGAFTPNYEPLNILSTGDVKAPYVGTSSIYSSEDGKTYEPGDMVSGAVINQLFIEQPERVLGDLRYVTSQYGPKIDIHSEDTSIPEIHESLSNHYTSSLPKNIHQPTEESAEELDQNSETAETVLDYMPGSVMFDQKKDAFVHRLPGRNEPANVNKRDYKRMLAALPLMEEARNLLLIQSKPETTDEDIISARNNVEQMYDTFVHQFGYVNESRNERLFHKDPRGVFALGLENYNPETKTAEKNAILSKRVLMPTADEPISAERPVDALGLSLTYRGMISLSYMTQLLNNADGDTEWTHASVKEALLNQGLAYDDPETDTLQSPDSYLSGNLKTKLEMAKIAAQSDESFQRNVDDLLDAWPEPLKPSEIKVGIDAAWLPQDIINDFISDALELPTAKSAGVHVTRDRTSRVWRIDPIRPQQTRSDIVNRFSAIMQQKWGTSRASTLYLLDKAFTNTMPIVRDHIPGTNDPRKYVVNAEETFKAETKLEEIKEAFDRWIYKDPERAIRIADFYNQNINTVKLTDPDGSHMIYPGMADKWVPRKHQNDLIWRTVSGRNTMTAHCVGAGKTFELIGSAVRGKQMGRWKKPMLIVPNHMLTQFALDAQDIFPGAKVLILNNDRMKANNRAAFATQAAMGDWDLIVTTHSCFDRIGVPPEFEASLIREELQKLKDALQAEISDKGAEKKRTPSQRDIEVKIKKHETKLKNLMSKSNKNKDSTLDIKGLGVDFIGVDEAHYYKNLELDTASSIPGMSVSASVRAWSLFLKSQFLMKEVHEAPYGVMLATGTPISNTVAELYTFTRMIRPDILEAQGIKNFNDWMGLYGKVVHEMELKPEGGGYQMKSRLSRFKNVPELVKNFRAFTDVKTLEDLNLPVPDVTNETLVTKGSDFSRMLMKYIEARARGARKAMKKDGGDSLNFAESLGASLRKDLYGANKKDLWAPSDVNATTDESNLEEDLMVGKDGEAVTIPQDILLSIASDGRKLSLDPRLLHPQFPDSEDSKVNLVVNEAMDIYQKHSDTKAAQLLFCDFSSPTGSGHFNVYADVREKLIAKGVPEKEIAFIHDAKSDDDKESLFTKVRSGEVRFLLGSTNKMGVGTNVQERLVAIHQIDPPWTPPGVEQRTGRLVRQGNTFDKVWDNYYSAEDSFDVFMWQTLKRKATMIVEAMRKPEECDREMSEDADMKFDDILAITTGNPKIKEFIQTKIDLTKLRARERNHLDNRVDMANRYKMLKNELTTLYSKTQAANQERLMVLENNKPLSLLIEGPQPGLQDGDTCHIGGLKGLANALKKQANLTRAFSNRSIGKLGGLEVVMHKKSDPEPAIMIRRFHGESELVVDVRELAEETANSQGLFDDEDDKQANDPYYRAARNIIMYVHRISRGEALKHQEDRIGVLMNNYQRTGDMLDDEFPEQEALSAIKAKYDQLLTEVGDDMNEDKEMDPTELIELAKYIHQHTDTGLSEETIALLGMTGIDVGLSKAEMENGDATVALA